MMTFCLWLVGCLEEVACYSPNMDIYISSHRIFLQGDYISPAEGHGNRMSFALESWQWLTSSLINGVWWRDAMGLDVK